MRRRAVAGGSLIVIAGFAGWYAFERHQVGALMGLFTAGAAKTMCSGVFASGRSPEHVRAEDFAFKLPPGEYIGLATTAVDFADKSVTASLFGLASRTAIFRDGIGCTAAQGRTVEELRAQGSGAPSSLPPADPGVQWPEGEATLAGRMPQEIDAAALESAIDFAFAEPEPEEPRRTRGVAVVHRGRIVAERYAAGFDEAMAHVSHSVAKSFTNALVGVLVRQGKLKVGEPAPIAEWRGAGDPRGEITLDQLLRMSSGLQFQENYTDVMQDTIFQYVGGDLAGYAAAKPLEAPPGARWQYSTGTSNILGRIVREAAGETFGEGFSFPRRELFDPLGMRHTVMEVDAAGNFNAGSLVYASVRDYARLGLLYLRDGVWNGTRILPEGWVAYTRTPTRHAPEDRGYGAQFWLNTGTNPSVRRWPALPADLYLMDGHFGQQVVIVPSRDAVIVRVGLSEFGNWKMADFTERVLSALPAEPEAPRDEQRAWSPPSFVDFAA